MLRIHTKYKRDEPEHEKTLQEGKDGDFTV